MSGIPILTLLTVLPLVGAAIALVSGKHARGVAMLTTGAALRWRCLCGRSCRRMGRLGWWSAQLGAFAGD